MSKRLLNNSMNVTLEEALDDEGLSQTVNFSTADTSEAMRGLRREASPEILGAVDPRGAVLGSNRVSSLDAMKWWRGRGPWADCSCRYVVARGGHCRAARSDAVAGRWDGPFGAHPDAGGLFAGSPGGRRVCRDGARKGRIRRKRARFAGRWIRFVTGNAARFSVDGLIDVALWARLAVPQDRRAVSRFRGVR